MNKNKIHWVGDDNESDEEKFAEKAAYLAVLEEDEAALDMLLDTMDHKISNLAASDDYRDLAYFTVGDIEALSEVEQSWIAVHAEPGS
jgi:hypothetical protein